VLKYKPAQTLNHPCGGFTGSYISFGFTFLNGFDPSVHPFIQEVIGGPASRQMNPRHDHDDGCERLLYYIYSFIFFRWTR